ncbi:GH22203 [Drosophila grimshawi]|uniref:GH22203 n=1 Tax=Drosophila grimshawi TaxID=7222 RepID=B4K0S8_DROGR|nr:GH22203 [Drosophila grimshawi]
MKLTWMQCRLLLLELVQPQALDDLLKDSEADVDSVDMEETVPPSASTSNEVTHDEDPNLSTAAPNFDSVEVRPTRPSKPPHLIAEGITNVVGLLEALNDVTPPDSFMLKCSGGGTVRVIPNGIDA